MNIKSNLKYYWWEFKSQFLGGYEIFKETFNLKQMKENFNNNIRIMREKDKYERQQKRFNDSVILESGSIIEFSQPCNSGNIVKAEILDVYQSFTYNCVMVKIKILESGLRDVGEIKLYKQIDILNTLLNANIGGNK